MYYATIMCLSLVAAPPAKVTIAPPQHRIARYQPADDDPLELHMPEAEPANTEPSTPNKPSTPVKAAPATPENVQVGVTIIGPSDGLRGDQLLFTAQTTGPAKAIRWRISPPVHGLLRLKDPRQVAFSNRKAQQYRLICAVAGAGGESVDVVEHEFEILAEEEIPEETEPAKTQAMPQQIMLPQQMLMQQGQPIFTQQPLQQFMPAPVQQAGPPALQGPTVDGAIREFTLQAMALVQSPTRAADARIVGGAFRRVNARIGQGTFPPNQDPLTAIQKEVADTLNGHSAAWLPFFQQVRGLLQSLQAQGKATNAITQSPILADIATVLALAR